MRCSVVPCSGLQEGKVLSNVCRIHESSNDLLPADAGYGFHRTKRPCCYMLTPARIFKDSCGRIVFGLEGSGSEVWQAVAHATEVEGLLKTTRDIPYMKIL